MIDWEHEDDYEIVLNPHPCKCGGSPEVYTSFYISKQMYEGTVMCRDCGEAVHSDQLHYGRNDAAEDAVDEWDMIMPEQEEKENDLRTETRPLWMRGRSSA